MVTIKRFCMVRSLLLLLTVTALTACQSAYYGTMERLGVPKREIMVSRITEAQEAQEEGQEQFKNALEQFRSVVNFDGGELQAVYDRLDAEFQDSEAAADRIRNRIRAVEDVADALFDEWEDELDLYSNDSLRRDSERQLQDTRLRYQRLLTAMHRAEQTIDPVLDNLRDNVLYLKHNLNARAIASIRGELDTINADVGRLIEAMEAAIAESDRFINEMQA
jgi:hypothetical protein